MFEGLKVVELASVLAGPMVGSFFSELGAEVLKIENSKTGGDLTRHWKLPSEDKSKLISAYYASANYRTSSLFLDLSKEADYLKALAAIKIADIVLVNFKPGDAIKLNLDYSLIKKINPTIIYAELTGFGQDDPRSAFDVVLQAETGFMSINGEKNARPLKMPVAFIDILAAHQFKEGILCAYIQRLKTNQGAKVSVSLYDSAIASLANQATNYLMADTIPARMGSEHPNIAPYGDLFQTLNGEWIVLAIGTDKQFTDLCWVLNSSHLSVSDKFETNAKRVIHRQELFIELDSIISQRTTKELEELFQSRKIPYGIVLDIKQVFDNTAAQKLIIEDEIDGHKAKRVKTVVFSLD
ncbi:MAG: CaiB/BaiF CoA transferase family protein [Chitinophagales bacterium]